MQSCFLAFHSWLVVQTSVDLPCCIILTSSLAAGFSFQLLHLNFQVHKEEQCVASSQHYCTITEGCRNWCVVSSKPGTLLPSFPKCCDFSNVRRPVRGLHKIIASQLSCSTSPPAPYLRPYTGFIHSSTTMLNMVRWFACSLSLTVTSIFHW